MSGGSFGHRVRALERGLHVLAVLNQFNGLKMPDLTAKTGMTRSAVYRILATLIEADYVVKSPSDGLYRVTAKVRDLSAGYAPDSWIKTVAAPILNRVSEHLAWPVSIVVLRNSQLITAHNTDRKSALVVRRVSAGTAIPVSGTAAGLVFLSFGEPELANALRRATLFSEQALLAQSEIDADELDQRIKDSQAAGHCVYQGTGYRALAVPMYRSGELYAAIAMRSNAEAAWPPEDDALYLATLKKVTAELEAAS